jgi:predicted  nucleic acid-binding Zn-ribbon protein
MAEKASDLAADLLVMVRDLENEVIEARKAVEDAEDDLATARLAREEAEEARDEAADEVSRLRSSGGTLEAMAAEVLAVASTDPHDPAWDRWFDLRARMDALA